MIAGPSRGNRVAVAAWLRARGLTLVEMVIAISIAAVIAMIALPKYRDYQEQLRVTEATYELGHMNFLLQQRMDETKLVPTGLSEIGQSLTKDPWGESYVYQDITGKGGPGKARKNKNLVPINTYFDVYSKGKDRQSVGPLTAGVSRDDIIVANDGRFVGMAKDYE